MHLRMYKKPTTMACLFYFLFYFYSEELFYQLDLCQFGDFSRIKLELPPLLRSLLELVVEADESTIKSQLSKTEILDVRYYIHHVLSRS